MTNKELIEKLRQLPGDAYVEILAEGANQGTPQEVEYSKEHHIIWIKDFKD